MVQIKYYYQKNGFDAIEKAQNSDLRNNPHWRYIDSDLRLLAGTYAGIPPIVAWLVYDDGARG